MLSPAGILAPLLLVAVLIVSAVAKQRQPASTLSAIILLRLPKPLQHLRVAKALPWSEIVLAALMLAPWSPIARLASWAALALLVTYLMVIARAMTFNPRPSCGCFGAIGDQRVRPKTVWRNAVFVTLAAWFVAFTSAGHTVPATLSSMGATGWVWMIGAALVVAAVILIGPGAAGQAPSRPMSGNEPPAPHSGNDHVDRLEDDEEDYVRSPIPRALLIDPEREPHLLGDMARLRAQLLVFVNCYCGSTHQALRTVQTWRDQLPQIDVRFIFSGVPVMESTPELSTEDSWLDHGALTWEKFALAQSPSAVLLGADGLLAGGPVGGKEEVDRFFEEVAEALSEAPLPEAADDPALSGEVVQSHTY